MRYIKQWNIVHTEVNEDYQGQGIARGLVNCVIENATSNNITITAMAKYDFFRYNVNGYI